MERANKFSKAYAEIANDMATLCETWWQQVLLPLKWLVNIRKSRPHRENVAPITAGYLLARALDSFARTSG